MTPKERSRKGAGEIVGNSLMFIGDSQVFYGEAMPYGFLKILRDQIVLIDAGTVRFIRASLNNAQLILSACTTRFRA